MHDYGFLYYLQVYHYQNFDMVYPAVYIITINTLQSNGNVYYSERSATCFGL